jgi:hypothetical protein
LQNFPSVRIAGYGRWEAAGVQGEKPVSQDSWRIVRSEKVNEADMQLALQCAPLIAGLKISNLLSIGKRGLKEVRKILAGSGISEISLASLGDRRIVLLYREHELVEYLSQPEVGGFFRGAGYESLELGYVFGLVRERYGRFMESKEDFPHELGLLLGYPVEDVTGFVINKGEGFLANGYWKVYENKEKKLRLFKRFEDTKEYLVQMLSTGVSMIDIINESPVYVEEGCI